MTDYTPAHSATGNEPGEDDHHAGHEDLWVGRAQVRGTTGENDITVANTPPVNTHLDEAYFNRTPFGDVTKEQAAIPTYKPPAQMPRQEARPHKWHTLAWYSLPCYIAVMSLMAMLFGWSVFAVHQSNGAFNYALGVSVLFGSFVFLRLARGSALDAQREMREWLHDRIGRISNPSAALHENEHWVSGRVAGELDLSNEPVLMEVRLHPVNILVAFFDNTRKTGVQIAALSYVISLGAIIVYIWPPGLTWLWYMLAGIVFGLVVFVWLTVADWYRCYFAITDNRFMKVHGLIGADAPSMLRHEITDVAVTIPWYSMVLQWMRIIDVAFGTWDVESTGQDQRLKYIRQMRWARELAVVIGLGRRRTPD